VGTSPILRLVAQRIALGVLLLFAVSALIFAGTQILPGDVASSILGQSATPQSLANLREELGLNDPAIVRYFTWLGGVLTGDLGTALTTRQDIATTLMPRLWNTLFLAFWTAIVAVPLAVLLGLLAVRYRNGPVDKTISGFALASTSLPEFFIGYLLIFFFAVKMQWFRRSPPSMTACRFSKN
jgi:peptide/nickel transport system permease protein